MNQSKFKFNQIKIKSVAVLYILLPIPWNCLLWEKWTMLSGIASPVVLSYDFQSLYMGVPAIVVACQSLIFLQSWICWTISKQLKTSLASEVAVFGTILKKLFTEDDYYQWCTVLDTVCMLLDKGVYTACQTQNLSQYLSINLHISNLMCTPKCQGQKQSTGMYSILLWEPRVHSSRELSRDSSRVKPMKAWTYGITICKSFVSLLLLFILFYYSFIYF